MNKELWRVSVGVEKTLKVSVLVTFLVRVNYISDLSISVEAWSTVSTTKKAYIVCTDSAVWMAGFSIWCEGNCRPLDDWSEICICKPVPCWFVQVLSRESRLVGYCSAQACANSSFSFDVYWTVHHLGNWRIKSNWIPLITLLCLC